MIVFNVMLSKGLGGIEQSFLNYNKLLLDLGYKVISITTKNAAIYSRLQKGVFKYELKNLGKWDFLSSWQIKKLFNKYRPKLIFAHGNRAVSMANRFIHSKYIYGVLHNSNINTIKNCQNIIIVSLYLKNLLHKYKNIQKIYHVPNIVDVSHINALPSTVLSNKTITVGVLGRFVPEKDFQTFIQSLTILQNDNINFKAVLGGEGPEKEKLVNLVKMNKLQEKVTFLGWVEDKKSFFNYIDIFCLTSIKEAFGIVIIEALAYGKPVIATNTEGPSEILVNEVDALIIPKKDYIALAASIKRLIYSESLRECLRSNGLKKVSSQYSESYASLMLDRIFKEEADVI